MKCLGTRTKNLCSSWAAMPAGEIRADPSALMTAYIGLWKIFVFSCGCRMLRIPTVQPLQTEPWVHPLGGLTLRAFWARLGSSREISNLSKLILSQNTRKWKPVWTANIFLFAFSHLLDQNTLYMSIHLKQEGSGHPLGVIFILFMHKAACRFYQQSWACTAVIKQEMFPGLTLAGSNVQLLWHSRPVTVCPQPLPALFVCSWGHWCWSIQLTGISKSFCASILCTSLDRIGAVGGEIHTKFHTAAQVCWARYVQPVHL